MVGGSGRDEVTPFDHEGPVGRRAHGGGVDPAPLNDSQIIPEGIDGKIGRRADRQWVVVILCRDGLLEGGEALAGHPDLGVGRAVERHGERQ
jgi:hypothetical protein